MFKIKLNIFLKEREKRAEIVEDVIQLLLLFM
jgi:hypothetical protein